MTRANPFWEQETPEELDNRKLDFGKHSGKTPIELFDEGGRDRSYIVWAYETVTRYNRPVFCSSALYRAAGGKHKSAKEQAAEKYEQRQRSVEGAAKLQPKNPARPASGFDDDFGDDIPF